MSQAKKKNYNYYLPAVISRRDNVVPLQGYVISTLCAALLPLVVLLYLADDQYSKAV